MRNRTFILPASTRLNQDFAVPVGFAGLGDVNEVPGTYGGIVSSCGCGGGSGGGLVGATQGVEGWVKAHPFLALAIAGAVGYALNGKRGRF